MNSRLETTPLLFCHNCGWTAWWPDIGIRAGVGGKMWDLSLNCPQCGSRAKAVNYRGIGEWNQVGDEWDLVDAARAAGLTHETVVNVAEFLRNDPPSTPEEAAAAFPALAPVLKAAAKISPGDWIMIVVALITLLAQILEENPSPQTTNVNITVTSTRDLSDEETRRIADQLRDQFAAKEEPDTSKREGR